MIHDSHSGTQKSGRKAGGNRRRRRVAAVVAPVALAAGTVAAPALLGASAGASPVPAGTSSGSGGESTYAVTVVNSTFGQPFSPPVAATHRKSERVLTDGRRATAALAAIAQRGDQSLAVAAYEDASRVTDVVDVGQPLTAIGSAAQPFPTTVSFEIQGKAGDRLSLHTMLICTNDGYAAVEGVKLPRNGTTVYPLRDYDAGVEKNTEASPDIVDPCSALGPVTLAGDPNGNVDDGDVRESRKVRNHQGVDGSVADLLPAHDWGKGPVGAVTITRLP